MTENYVELSYIDVNLSNLYVDLNCQILYVDLSEILFVICIVLTRTRF